MTNAFEPDRVEDPGSEQGVKDTFNVAFRNTSIISPAQLSPFVGKGQIRIRRDGIRVAGKRKVEPKFSVLRVIGVVVAIPLALVWVLWLYLILWLLICMIVGSLAKYWRTAEGSVEYQEESGVRVEIRGRLIWIEGSHYKMRLANKDDVSLVEKRLAMCQGTGAAMPVTDSDN